MRNERHHAEVLEVSGLVKRPTTWTWDEFVKLPHQPIHADIHCVTRWSTFDTNWTGVSLDDIMRLVVIGEGATHLIARSYGGYSTNLPIADIINKQAFVATAYEEDDIPPPHGGPARLFVPHLYFWRSAKWLKALEFVDHDEPGFWETRGYHSHGDPWREQRYSDDGTVHRLSARALAEPLVQPSSGSLPPGRALGRVSHA